MMKKKIGILIAAAVGTMLLLPGCTEQSVTYDPNAAQATSAPAQAVAAATATPTPTATPTAAATATPTVSVTATPTPTQAPVITPIAPIEITPTVNPDAGLKLIGEKKEGDSIFKARLKNGTNFTIAWFSVKDNFTDYYPKNQLGEKENIEKGETRVLYYDAAHAMRESADREEKAEYLIRFAIKTDEELKDEDSEGHYYIIHNIPFEDLEEAEICFNEQTAVPYIKYKSKKSGALVSTEKEETAIYGKDSSEDDSSDNGSGQSSEGSQGNASPARDDEEESNRNTDADDSNTGNTNNSSNNGSSNNGNTNTGNTDTDDEEEEPEDTIIGFDEDPDVNGDEGNGDEDNNDDEIIYYDDTYDNVEAVG